MNLARAVQNGRTLRVVGFDDSPFDKNRRGQRVLVCGIVCRGTRFDGMVATHIRKDGWNATHKVIDSLRASKFREQLHLVLFDGIAMGGFNVLDLVEIESALEIPAVAIMRNEPDMPTIERALQNLPRPERRMARIRRAGEVHAADHCHFQVVGADPAVIRVALSSLTDVGHIPEAIRIAHLVGSGVVSGESGRRA